jgi:hypothetical protein
VRGKAAVHSERLSDGRDTPKSRHPDATQYPSLWARSRHLAVALLKHFDTVSRRDIVCGHSDSRKPMREQEPMTMALKSFITILALWALLLSVTPGGPNFALAATSGEELQTQVSGLQTQLTTANGQVQSEQVFLAAVQPRASQLTEQVKQLSYQTTQFITPSGIAPNLASQLATGLQAAYNLATGLQSDLAKNGPELAQLLPRLEGDTKLAAQVAQLLKAAPKDTAQLAQMQAVLAEAQTELPKLIAQVTQFNQQLLEFQTAASASLSQISEARTELAAATGVNK